MNKELQKLLKQINDKKNEVKSLVNDGKLDKAKAAKEELKELGTNEKYNALQIGLENTIMFETRACDKMEEIRLNLKEFYAVYKGVEFKIYDACPMFTDDRKYQLKCRAGA